MRGENQDFKDLLDSIEEIKNISKDNREMIIDLQDLNKKSFFRDTMVRISRKRYFIIFICGVMIGGLNTGYLNIFKSISTVFKYLGFK